MKIVVTGSKGFIGKRLVACLKSRGAVVAEIDLGDHVEDLVGEWDVFYNLAWAGKGGPLRADYNLQMSNVHAGITFYKQAIRLRCKRYICAGTIGEKMCRLPECSGIKSQNLIYALSKNYLHDILKSISVETCPLIWATLGNIYGSADAGGTIIDYCLREVLSERRAAFGPAEQPYDFVYVDDLVDALAGLAMSDNVKSEELYLGYGQPRLLKEYLHEIGRVLSRMDLIGVGDRPDDGTRYKREWFDISRLTEETGFRPQVDFETGIALNVKSVSNALAK